jgi:hypothetical protein
MIELNMWKERHLEQQARADEERAEQQVQHREQLEKMSEQLRKMDEQRAQQQVQHQQQLQKMDQLIGALAAGR